MSVIVYYLLFWLVRLYDFDGSVTSFLTEISRYVFVFIGSWICGLGYGQIYPYWKKTLRRTLAIVHGNIVSYYFLLWGLGIQESIALIIIVGSILGWLIAFSNFTRKNYYLIAIVVITIGFAMIETIPVYPHTIRLGLLLEQQYTYIYSLETNNIGKVTVETTKGTQSYDLGTFTTENPLVFINPPLSVSYNSATSSQTPVLIQLWDGTVVFLYPQTQISFSGEINFSQPFLSPQTYSILGAGGGYISPHTTGAVLLSSGTLSTGNNTFVRQGLFDEASQEEKDLFVDSFAAYQDRVQQKAYELYAREASSSPILEQISYAKVLLYQLFDPYSYNIIEDNYLQYRYLVFGDDMPYNSDILFIKPKKVEQQVLTQEEEADPIQVIQEGTLNGLGNTRFLKKLTW